MHFMFEVLSERLMNSKANEIESASDIGREYERMVAES